MFSLTSQRIFVFALLCVATSVFAHSQMRCAKYNKATGACSAPIRNQAVSHLQEAYSYNNGAPICQTPMANPISAAYANGAECPDWAPCPAPMGTYTPGEQFTVMWFARNHAVENQNPASVRLYLSPRQNANQGQDVSASTMAANMFCSGPYMNCGGVNQDQTPCTADCTMPSNTQPGIYTLWWKWDWQGAMYTTCADIVVTGSSTPNPPAPTPAPVVTTGRTVPVTTGRTPAVTTGRTAPVTTGRSLPVTTGTAATPSPVTPSPVTPSPVTPSPVTPSPVPSGGSPCTLGHQRCASSNTYQTCGWASSTITGWSQAQACPNGLSCHAVQGNYVWCY